MAAASAPAGRPPQWHAHGGGGGGAGRPSPAAVATAVAVTTAATDAAWCVAPHLPTVPAGRHGGGRLPRIVPRRLPDGAARVVPPTLRRWRRAQWRPPVAAVPPPPTVPVSVPPPAADAAGTPAARGAAATAAATAAAPTDGGRLPDTRARAGAGAEVATAAPALAAPGEGGGGAPPLPVVDVPALRASLARRRSIRRWGMATSAAAAAAAAALSPLPPPPAGFVVAVVAAAAGWAAAGGGAELGRDGRVYLHSPLGAGRRALRGGAVGVGRRVDWRVPFPPVGSVVVRPTGDRRGWGVFAAVDLPAGTPLGEYEGDLLDTAAFFGRYPPDGAARGDYVVAVDAEWVVDGAAAAAAARAAATYTPSLMNHARDGAPVARVARRRARAVGFVTTRRVAAGEELCWDYGRAYWVGREAEEMV